MGLISRLAPRAHRGRRRGVMTIAAIATIASAHVAIAQPEATPDAPEDTPAATPGETAPAYPPGTIPEGFRKFEVVDLTQGMRNDSFAFVTVDPRDPDRVYVGSDYGRVYISDDNGELWTESTVIREQKNLWGAAGQKQLFRHIRNDGGQNPPPNLAGPIGLGAAHHGLLGATEAPEGTRAPQENVSFGSPVVPDAFETSKSVAGAGGGLVVIGGSARAPRLSRFLARKGKPVPVIGLTRFVLGAGNRPTGVWRIVPHPTDPQILFAGTANGLYKSYDGGTSWVRAFPGLSRKERAIRAVVFDPKNQQRVYLGSSRGLYISDDGGENWSKSTRVPGVLINHIVVDPKDSRYMYIAANGGVWRSSDGGENFRYIYYASLPRQRDVRWIELDPFDPNTAYIATADGMFVTHKVREAGISDWESMAGLRTLDLVIPQVRACTRHPGHIYALTRADLYTISYGANGPEVYLIESWDGGKSWRILASNRTRGDVRWFSLDPNNPDTVWVAWKAAIVRIERAGTQRRATQRNDAQWQAVRANLGMPTIGEVIDHTLDHHGLSLDIYQDNLHALKSRNWLPARLSVVGFYARRGYSLAQQDVRFPDAFRFLNYGLADRWQVLAIASWRLPDIVHHHQAEAMAKLRLLEMNNALRESMLKTVQRSYGELLRLRAKMKRDPPEDLKTRAIYHVRMEQLEAMVDLASGGYLSRQTQQE